MAVAAVPVVVLSSTSLPHSRLVWTYGLTFVLSPVVLCLRRMSWILLQFVGSDQLLFNHFAIVRLLERLVQLLWHSHCPMGLVLGVFFGLMHELEGMQEEQVRTNIMTMPRER